MADDFKKLAKDLKNLNKSMDMLGQNAKKQANQNSSPNVSGNNSISNPMADARDSFSQFSNQAAAIGKLHKVQTAAVSGMAQYTLKEQRIRDKRNTKESKHQSERLNRIDRNTFAYQGVFTRMFTNMTTNMMGLMPNRAARLRTKKADLTQIKDASFTKLRTVSIVNMMEMMKSDKEMAKAKIDADIKFQKGQALKRKQIYKEQRKAGATAKEAFRTAVEETKESEEERAERIRRDDRNNAGLLDALIRPFTMDDKTLQALADGGASGILKGMFKWLKAGAILAGIGALIGDSIGNWLGDQTDKIFGKNSWLGNIFRDNGWLGGAIAGLAAAVLAPTALITAISGLGSLLLGPAGLVLAAGMAGYLAGTYLYDNLVGPWIDDFYKRKNEEADKFDKKETKQSTITTAEGKKEHAFVISTELAGKYSDITGGSTVIGESVASQIAAGEKTEGGLMGAAEGDFEKTGIRRATFTTEAETGAAVMGQESFTAESALEETQQAAAKRGLQAGASMKGGFAAAYDSLFKMGRQFRKLSNLYDALSRKTWHKDEYWGEMDLNEQGFEEEIKTFRTTIGGFKSGFWRDLKNATPEEQKTLRKAYSDMVRHFAPLSSALLSNPGNEWVDSFWDENKEKYRIGVYGSMRKFYGKGASQRGYNDWVNPAQYDIGFRGIKLAEGGLVNSAISAIIGEAGPEAVLPLNKAVDAIAGALSKSANSPSMKALASRQKLEMAGSASGRAIGGGPSSNTTIVTSQNNSSFVNLTPRATTNSGPSWIKTVCD